MLLASEDIKQKQNERTNERGHSLRRLETSKCWTELLGLWKMTNRRHVLLKMTRTWRKLKTTVKGRYYCTNQG